MGRLIETEGQQDKIAIESPRNGSQVSIKFDKIILKIIETQPIVMFEVTGQVRPGGFILH